MENSIENVVKQDEKQMNKMWKEFEKNFEFSYHLNRLTKDELVEIGKKYGVKGLTSLKKADLVDKLIAGILENLEAPLNFIEKDGFNLLSSLVKHDGLKSYEDDDFVYADYFRSYGLVFTGSCENENLIIMPEEVSKSIKSKLTADVYLRCEANTDFIKTFAGMLYYYGVIDIEDAVSRDLIEHGADYGYDYVVEGNYACHIDVIDMDVILNKQQEREDILPYRFDKKALLKAGSPDFREENKQVERLEKVFGELFVIDKESLNQEMEEFVVAIKNEQDTEEAAECFLTAYEIESDDERTVLKAELVKLAKSIRKWSLKGYTENEIEQKDRNTNTAVKIGRNDPCTCGSGKKYKKCCAK
ncbi:MAG: SEC-C metal-binding domain-containing protein [Clostridium sp.]